MHTAELKPVFDDFMDDLESVENSPELALYLHEMKVNISNPGW